MNFLKKWWPSAITLLVVLYATLWPDPVGADRVMLFPGADKLIHAIMMGGLLSAFLFDFRRQGKSLTARFVIIMAVIVVIFSAFDEYAQKTMNLGRSFELLDLLADAGGVLIAAVTAPPVINRIFRKSKPLDSQSNINGITG